MISKDENSRIDLHTHSNASDGALTPAALVEFAQNCGVQTLALTDHDCVCGLKAAQERAEALALRFIPGIELSVNWADTCIHVVGLGIDAKEGALLEACASVSKLREERSHRISACLERLGIAGMFEAVYDTATNRDNISRLHFAHALLARGIVQNEQEAFDRFLGVGRPAYVATAWPMLEVGIALIHAAGGVAVLAHPGRYRFAQGWQREALVLAFARAGGDALEVSSGSQSSEFTQICATWVRDLHLLASSGSDFHRPDGARPLPGAQAGLPTDLPCVLERL